MTNFVAIIQAKCSDKRFPNKPLTIIGGKTIVQRIYEQAAKEFENVFVATDSEKVLEIVGKFGGKAILTLKKHKSSTNRCAEACRYIIKNNLAPIDVVINIQGNEPFVTLSQLYELKKCFKLKRTQIATLIKPINNKEDIINTNEVKVVKNPKNEAIYFSRSPIPFIKGKSKENWVIKHQYFKNIAIFAYRLDILNELAEIKIGELEQAESLDQLRWIENSYKVKLAFTEHDISTVFSPKDLEKFNQISLI